MLGSLRTSGIDVVGDVPWGTHFCQFYQSQQDLVDTLVPYFVAGIESGEYCMWVASEPLVVADAERSLRAALPDLDEYLRRGQLEIIPHSEWYLLGGRFDSERVLRGWVDRLGAARARGFEGLRLSGNTFWLEKGDWRDFADYEEQIHRVIGKHQMLALCTYALDRCSASEVIDVVTNHQYAIIKRDGEWRLIENFELKRADERIRRQNAILDGIGRVFLEALTSETEEALGSVCLRVAEEVTQSRFGFLGKLGADGRLDDLAISDTGWAACRLQSGSGRRAAPAGLEIHGLYGRVLRDGIGYFTNDPAEHLAGSGIPVGHPPLEAFLGAPLKEGGKTVGIVALGNREGGYRVEDLEALEALAPAIAQAFASKRAEGERERLLARLNAVVENTDAELALLDRDLNFVMVNSAYVKGSGHAKEELIGRNHFELFPHAENQAIFERVRDTGQPYQAIEKPFEFADQPERETTYWNWILVPIEAASGQVEGLLLSLVDVTAQVRARQEVETLAVEAERRAAELDASLAAIADGLVIYGPRGEVLRMNAVAEEILGQALAEQEPLTAESLASHGFETPEGRRVPTDELPHLRALRGEVVPGDVLGLRGPRDEVRWLMTSAAPIRSAEGELLGAVSNFADVTLLFQLKAYQEEMTSLISHDLRNPLTALMGQAQLLGRSLTRLGLTKEGEIVTTILRSAHRINMMIQDLVDSARLTSGQLAMRFEPTDLGDLVLDVRDQLFSPDDSARVEVQRPERLPLVRVDRERLERVLVNLVGNACKYSAPEEPVIVRVAVEGCEAVVSVTDRGVGIPTEELPHVFSKYFRASTGRQTEGLGLGLYIARLIVEAHGGRIGVESRSGAGSTFTIRLPRSDPSGMQSESGQGDPDSR